MSQNERMKTREIPPSFMSKTIKPGAYKLTTNIIDFLNAYPDEVEFPGVTVEFEESQSSEINIVLRLNRNVKRREIEAALPKIADWVDKLNDWDPHGILDYQAKFLLKLLQRKTFGIPYSEIAKLLNSELDDYLRDYAQFASQHEEFFEGFATYGDYWAWRVGMAKKNSGRRSLHFL